MLSSQNQVQKSDFTKQFCLSHHIFSLGGNYIKNPRIHANGGHGNLIAFLAVKCEFYFFMGVRPERIS